MGNKLKWDENFLLNHWKFADKDTVLERMKGQEKAEDFHFEINKQYPLYKDLFGVQIEFGSIRAVKIIITDAMETLDRLVEIIKMKEGLNFNVINDLDGMTWVAEKYQLEKPDVSAIQGYVLNNELIEFVNGDGYDFIKMKYKDSPENIFYIYKFYFSLIDNELFLIIEKNI